MIYLSGTLHRALYGTPGVGMMLSPASTKQVPDGMAWAADNGAFLGKYPGDDPFLAWLDAMPRAGCLFAVAPDVVGNAAATWGRSAPLLPRIRALGFRAALAGQDGFDAGAIEWRAFDVLFLGGTDAWKLGGAGQAAARDALARGKTVHVGRVNSWRRLAWAAGIGAASCDGTTIKYRPSRYVPELRRWIARINAPMFDLGDCNGLSALCEMVENDRMPSAK